MRLTKAQLTELALFAEEPAETPEVFVERLIEKYWELIGEKHWYAGVMQIGGVYFMLGPFTTVGAARRAGCSPIPFVTYEGWKKKLAETKEPQVPKVFREIAEDAEKFKAARRRK